MESFLDFFYSQDNMEATNLLIEIIKKYQVRSSNLEIIVFVHNDQTLKDWPNLRLNDYSLPQITKDDMTTILNSAGVCIGEYLPKNVQNHDDGIPYA